MQPAFIKENTALENTKITLFKGGGIRKILHKNEWWFSVVDVIEAVTESERPRKYWSDLKKAHPRGVYSVFRENRTTEAVVCRRQIL